MAREVGKRLDVLLPPGTEQSWAYKTYMEARKHMAREMTPQERAAAIIRDCPEVWNQTCHISQETFEALVKRITEFAQQTRRAALLEAANIAFDHACDDPRSCNCNTVIYRALDRLAQEG